MEVAECGAAALAIIFSFHRLHLSLERLREECGVSRDGTHARRLLQVAGKFGFNAKGFCKEPEQLLRVPLPAIIHWRFNHFVVLEGISKDAAWINDPERGRRRLTRTEFDQAFTGPVLVFEPGPDFKTQGAPPGLWSALIAWIRGSEWAVVYLVCVGLFLLVPGIGVPILMRFFVDRVLVVGHSDQIGALFTGMMAIAFCYGLLTWMQRRALARLSCRLVSQLSSSYLRQAMRLPFSFYLARHPGDLASRVEIGDRLSWLLSGDLPATLFSVIQVFFYGVLLLILDPWLAGLAFLIATSGLCVDRFAASFRSEKAHEAAHEQARSLALAVNGLQMIETFKANGAESKFFRSWCGQEGRAVMARHRVAVVNEVCSSAVRGFHALGGIAVLGAGALHVMDGEMTVGTLVAFQSLYFGFVGPLSELSAHGARLAEIRAQVARFQDVLNHPLTTASKVPPAPVPSEKQGIGRIEFRCVRFGYNPLQAPVVEELTFAVSPGQRVAIVGQTGSGKSTVARLASGLVSPWAGEILVDGCPIEAWASVDLASRVATVEQESCILEGSIEDNISLGNSSVSHEAMFRALRDACLDERLARLPGGLDARLSEGGRDLSGGERQRLELARALARDPMILILDEATSALDALTEQRVYDRIRQRGCACIIVAHRLSSIRDCDEILVMDRGRIVERGRHERLFASDGIYRRLVTNE